MRGRTQLLHCDAEDGECGAWSIDFYEATVSKIDGKPVTRTERAPGWLSDDESDYCPDHAVTTPAHDPAEVPAEVPGTADGGAR